MNSEIRAISKKKQKYVTGNKQKYLVLSDANNQDTVGAIPVIHASV